MKQETIEMIGVTAELMGQALSEAALRIMVSDLSRFPDADLMRALEKLRVQGGKFSMHHIVALLPGQFPSAEEAWSLVTISEDESACVTDEMMAAYGQVEHLDRVAGRMAFKEIYDRMISEKKFNRQPPKWFISAGKNKELVEHCALKALKRAQISFNAAKVHLYEYPDEQLVALADGRKDVQGLIESKQNNAVLERLEKAAENYDGSEDQKATALNEIGKLKAMLALSDDAASMSVVEPVTPIKTDDAA